MSENFYNVKDWFELISYIATIIGVISVIVAVSSIIKNNPNRNNFKVDLNIQHLILTWDGVLITATLNFENFTDKEFSIVSVYLCINKIDYTVNVRANLKNTSIIPLKDIYLNSHASETINECFITIPEDLNITVASLKVKTTVGNFIYSINVRKLHDDIQKLK